MTRVYSQGGPLPDVPAADIEHLAREMAAEGRTLRDACPYPWGTPAAHHFTAVFFLAGGAMDDGDDDEVQA